DERVVLAECQPAVTLDQEIGAGAPVGHRDQVAQRVQPVLVDLERCPQHVLGDDLERATRARELGEHRVPVRRGDAIDRHRASGGGAGGSWCWITSTAHSSLALPTGPPLLCALWPCWNAGLFTHAWKASSDCQRV